MNRTLTLTNSLLAIIAFCLCLLVLRVYDVSLVPEAQAMPQGGVTEVRVVNDTLPCTVSGTVSASIGTGQSYNFQPLRSVNGKLEVVVREP